MSRDSRQRRYVGTFIERVNRPCRGIYISEDAMSPHYYVEEKTNNVFYTETISKIHVYDVPMITTCRCSTDFNNGIFYLVITPDGTTALFENFIKFLDEDDAN